MSWRPKNVPGWKKFLAQFQNVLVVLLLIATAISAGLWLYEGDAALPCRSHRNFANIRKFLRYLLSSNIGEVLAVFFGAVLADAVGLKAEKQLIVLPGSRPSSCGLIW
jgi:magnesium-transporting ATPase (P-type)